MHRINRIVSAFGRRFIAYIYGISARLGNVGRPYGATLRPGIGHRPHPARRTVAEGILAAAVDLARVGEPRTSRTPRLPAVALGILSAAIVVGQNLVQLHVPLAGQQHASPRIFEHRHQIGQHVALRIEVFAGHPQPRPLPPPAVLRLIEITAMALPQSDMPARQSFDRRRRRVETHDQRPLGAVGERDDLPSAHQPLQLLRIAAGHRHELPDFVPVGIELDTGLAERHRQQSPHTVAHRPDILLAERIVGQPYRGIDPHLAPRSTHALHLHITARHFAGHDAGQRPSDFPPGGRIHFGGRGFTESQQEDKER